MELFIDQFIKKERLNTDFRILVDRAYFPIAEQILKWNRSTEAPLVIGINGAQGTGKSTLSRFLSDYFREEYDLNAFVLSLDDLYKTYQERYNLSQLVHPLLITRGVPGTHSVDIALDFFKSISSQLDGTILSPRFRKEIDDRVPKEEWNKLDLPVDIILFEGWCVSARAQSLDALSDPINAFESKEDSEGTWRSYVNQELATCYAEMFSYIDHTILLRTPSFETIVDWRMEQEQKLRASCEENGFELNQHFMTKVELERFISHFERLTRWMLVDMSNFAEMVIDFNVDRSFKRLLIKNYGN